MKPQKTNRERGRKAVFLSACLLLSGCAGGGGAGSFRQDLETKSGSSKIAIRSLSETDSPQPVRVPIGFPGERTTSFVRASLDVFLPPAVTHRQDKPYAEPYKSPGVITKQDETYPQPYKPPVVISRSEPEPGPSPLPVPAYIQNAEVFNYCGVIIERATNPGHNRLSPSVTDPCNRARIHGLTRLRSAVAANVAAKLNARITPQKYGAIIDFQTRHGRDVLETAVIAAPRELLDLVRVRNQKYNTVLAFKNLNPDNYGGNTIVNISQADVFSTNSATAECGLYRRSPGYIWSCNFITPEDVQSAKALMVISAGNFGPDQVASYEHTYSRCKSGTGKSCMIDSELYFINGKFVFNPSSASRLEIAPEQPAHNLDALQAVHEQTGSILIVAGQTGGLFPLTDQNGLHRRYGSTSVPVIHGSSNRCGMAMRYCVTAPYSIFNGFRRVSTGDDGEPIGYFTGIHGTSFATPLVTGTLVNLRYVWPHLTNRQLVSLACVTAEDLGATGIDAIYGCGQFSVSAIWQPTGELVDNPESSFSLAVSAGGLTISGGAFDEPVTVTGYENNEFRRDYEVAVAASDSGTSVRIDPTVSWNSLNSILRFRQNGATSLPLADGRGSATHIFKDTFLFLKGSENSFGALGLSHGSGFSIAFERETDSFFGSFGSGSYKFGDTNKIVASFDREFQMGKTYNAGVKLAAAYGKMEPDISLVNSASGGAQTAQLSVGRKGNNFETRVEMSYSTGLKGEISVQNTNYRLRPISEKAIMLKMRLAI